MPPGCRTSLVVQPGTCLSGDSRTHSAVRASGWAQLILSFSPLMLFKPTCKATTGRSGSAPPTCSFIDPAALSNVLEMN